MKTKPLINCSVILTRPKNQSIELIKKIRAAGGKIIEIPTIKITSRNSLLIKKSFLNMPTPDIAIFISSNAAIFGSRFITSEQTKIIAIGQSTAKTLKNLGKKVEIQPKSTPNSENLLKHPQLNNVEGLNIVIIRAKNGRKLLGSELKKRGASVKHIAVYNREPELITEQQILSLNKCWESEKNKYLVTLSSETLESFFNQLPAKSRKLMQKTILVLPSKRMLKKAIKMIPNINTLICKKPHTNNIINSIINYELKNKKNG